MSEQNVSEQNVSEQNVSEQNVFARILDFANRADPYPLWAELRRTPVAPQTDGSYVVSTYREISALRRDPRLSSDMRTPEQRAAGDTPPMLRLDPPDHDRARRLVMKHFGPPQRPTLVDDLRPELTRMVTELIDAFPENQVDIVDQFAYPFPVSVICTLLGVPREDEPRFREWTDVLVDTLDPAGNVADRDPTKLAGLQEFIEYLQQLIADHRRRPGPDLISAMATDDAADRLTDQEIVSTSILLLIAGHETTVNLIANGMLTFLRHPTVLKRLHEEPAMIIPAIEEVLRYEPSVQMIPWRKTLDDVEVAGTTIPKGAQVILALAAGNRDPLVYSRPDAFDIDRGAQHLSFSGGIHYCFGAPLARLEAQVALGQLVDRLENPVLVTDPPPYRPSPVLRGPQHLVVGVDRIT
jgi:cytochrome P450